MNAQAYNDKTKYSTISKMSGEILNEVPKLNFLQLFKLICEVAEDETYELINGTHGFLIHTNLYRLLRSGGFDKTSADLISSRWLDSIHDVKQELPIIE